MIETMRWFGPDDPVPLAFIRQAGATGVVTAMHDIPLDRAWTASEVRARRQKIKRAGLDWTVVESIPVAEEIKATGLQADEAVETWLASLRAVAEAGIGTVCYNFPSASIGFGRTPNSPCRAARKRCASTPPPSRPSICSYCNGRVPMLRISRNGRSRGTGLCGDEPL